MAPKLTDFPVRYDLAIRQGGTFRRRFTWRDGNDDLVDLTDWTATLTARRAAADTTDPLMVLTEADAITLGNGTIDVRIEAEDTAAIDWRRAVFDLKLTDPSQDPDFVVPFMEGAITVTPEVGHA